MRVQSHRAISTCGRASLPSISAPTSRLRSTAILSPRPEISVPGLSRQIDRDFLRIKLPVAPRLNFSAARLQKKQGLYRRGQSRIPGDTRKMGRSVAVEDSDAVLSDRI